MDGYRGLPNKPFKCTYAHCEQRFQTEKEMKRHKQHDPEHDYCKKCDVDCEDWDDFHEHKVDAMRPWLDGSVHEKEKQAPRHITCEFCSLDFKSFGGRRVHVEQQHQADQHIECPGCKHVFARARDLAAHIEFGHCSQISSRDFISSIQQKYVIKQIMQEPGTFLENLQVSKALSGFTGTPGQIRDETVWDEEESVQDEEDGGASLLDQIHEDDSSVWGGLQPEADSVSHSHPNATDSAWPRLSNAASSDVTKAMGNLWVDSHLGSTSHASIPTSLRTDSATNPGNRAGGDSSAYADLYPPLHHTNDSDTASQASTVIGAGFARPSAWRSDRTPQTPANPGQWDSHLQQRRREDEAANNKRHNMLYNRFWDPSDVDYQPNLFCNASTNRFFCPFAECEMCEYDTQSDFEAHLYLAHTRRQYRCPLCLKLFRSASTLIGHCEAPGGRCRVKESAGYKKLIDDISGGFIKVQSVTQPRLFEADTALRQKGHMLHGVTRNMYTAKMPEEQ